MSQVLSPALARAAEYAARRDRTREDAQQADSASRIPQTWEPHCVMTWRTQVAAMDEMVRSLG